MPVFHSRCLRPQIRTWRCLDRRINLYLSYGLAQHLHGNCTRTKQSRHITGYVHDRRLYPDSHRTAIQDHLNLAFHVLPYMLCRGRAWSAGSIGARCCHRNPSQFDQTVCHRVTWHTDCYRIQPAGRSVRHNVTFRKYHGKRSRPECLRQLPARLRNVRYKRFQFVQTGNMRNQWVVRRAALCCVNFLSRSLIQCIRAKTVNRLGRKCHQTAGS